MTSSTLRRRCQKLARRMGCFIEIERVGFGSNTTMTYWVWPGRLYTTDDVPDSPFRTDPNDGDHACAGWSEVWNKLLVYNYDAGLSVHGLSWERGEPFYQANFPVRHVLDLIAAADPALLAACVHQPADAAPWLILADWLQERDHERLAGILRKSVRVH